MAAFFITLLVFLAGVAILGRRAINAWIARRSAARQEQIAGERCKCGYPLTKLDLARCPECGRVLNFDVSAEDLGLTREELARIAEKRRMRASGPDHHATD